MYIGDLHIHSRYSRATSKDCTPEYLDFWARKKGIDIIGTGDFTHPAWREELKEKLEPAEDGLYVLKKQYCLKDAGAPDNRRPRFVVTGEISSIYKKMDRVRKVHSLLLLPGLEEADGLARRLELIGNIYSDGRPILGLDCRDLLEIMLEMCPEAVYIPAHIWTPHFSLFGAFSGFDRIEDCFGDLTPHIHALETGLSSDPAMNWRISALDSFQLISNSDAHSPAKLGREATLFNIEMCYTGLARAIKYGQGLEGTLEFFPEEGKYHFDGHRKCGLSLSPKETKAYGNICPVCGKKITIGVLHRVEELADREEGYRADWAKAFESLVPLPEVIAASTGSSAAGKKVQEQYNHMIQSLGTEFSILRQIPVEDIRKAAGPLIAEGIMRLRSGKVNCTPGFDGEYGTVRLLRASEISMLQGQLSLFTPEELQKQENDAAQRRDNGLSAEYLEAGKADAEAQPAGEEYATAMDEKGMEENSLNCEQEEAVTAMARAVAVIAGPGAGKTKTLIARLLYLLEERGVKPCEVTAVTFTNQAAEEMRSRMGVFPGKRQRGKQARIGTFHSICFELLRDKGINVSIADEGMQRELAGKAKEKFGINISADRFLRALSLHKCGAANLKEDNLGEMDIQGSTGSLIDGDIPQEAFEFYQQQLKESGAFDYDDLLLETLKLFEKGMVPVSSAKNFKYLLVDEFQDINPIQYRLIRAWNWQGRELFVIGDPDQSIYGFRGSDARCFDRLREDFPGVRVIELQTNYRSTPEILSGALAVISNNGGKERCMQPVTAHGRPIRIVTAADERNEAIFIAKEINRLIGGIDMLDAQVSGVRREIGVRSFSDIALLYRTHRQAGMLEDCLRHEGIPYVVAGREDFLLEDKVRAALGFFQYVLNPEDELAKAEAGRLMWPEEKEASLERIDLLAQKYKKAVRRTKPVRLLEDWAADTDTTEHEGMKKLADMSVLYSTMESFIKTISLGEDGDIRRSSGRKFQSDAVKLMTFHGSKGLEYPVVFLYGIRHKTTPLELRHKTANRQEERRLFYVGMTRARQELILTTSGVESVFLKEIPEHVAQRECAGKEKAVHEAQQLNLFDFMH